MELRTSPYSAIAQGGTWKVTYTEPSGSLMLDFEMGVPKAILWVPSEADWVRYKPGWAQGRRLEIVERAARLAFGSDGVELSAAP